MTKIKLLLADDHLIVRDGISSILKTNNDFDIIHEVSNGREVLDFLAEQDEHPDVILMDINMPIIDGIVCTKEITKKYSDIEVIALTMVKQKSYIKSMLTAGASGYLLKNADREELFEAIYSISKGQNYFSRSISNEVMFEMMQLNKRKKSKNIINLTSRETEVLNLIVKDFSNPEIAEKLNISTRTVESHKQNLLAKSGTKNTAGLVIYALKNQLITLNYDD